MIIQSGTFEFHKGEFPEMISPSGPRRFVKFIKFAECFHRIPTVFVSIRALDAINDSNLRVDVSLDGNPLQDGFPLRLSTWNETRLWMVKASWIAYGER